jgi:hypothetical protein
MSDIPGGGGGGGVNLAGAQGVVTVTANTAAAQTQLANFAQLANQTMAQVGAGAGGANSAFATLRSTLGQLSGAFGITLGIAGAVKLGEMAVEADQLSVSYKRQEQAAVALAGSQGRLNDMLAAYDQAAHGSLSQSQELSEVERLLSLRLADSAQQLQAFGEAARTVSFANSESQADATNDIITAVLTQRRQAFARLGISYDEVTAKTKTLMSADAGLTQESATLQVILELVHQRFGDIGNQGSSGFEKVTAAMSDLKKATGDLLDGPISALADVITRSLKDDIVYIHDTQKAFEDLGAAIGRIADMTKGLSFSGMTSGLGALLSQSWNALTGGPSAPAASGGQAGAGGFSAGGGTPPFPQGPKPGGGGFTTDIAPISDLDNMKIAWLQQTQEIEQRASNMRLEATNQYEAQRSDTIMRFGQQIAREEEDFGIQRMREQRDVNQQIAKAQEDAGIQQAIQARNLAQNIAQAQADSADRLSSLREAHDRDISQRRQDFADRAAEEQLQHDEDIAKQRADSADRIAQLEDDHNTQRQKNARDHQERLTDAALNNDAKAVFFEQRRYQDQESDADRAFQKQVTQEEKRLNKSIDQSDQAFEKRNEDEKKALDKSVRQSNEAYGRQVEDEKKALDKRITQAQTAYNQQVKDETDSQARMTKALHDAENTREEDEKADIALRAGRETTDYNEELGRLDTQHGNRLTQIDNQQQEELDKFNTKFGDQLFATGHFVDEMKTHYDTLRNNAVKAFDDWWRHFQEKLNTAPTGGTAPRQPPPHHLLR